MTELAEKTNSTNISTNTNAPTRPGANPSDSTMARAQGQAQNAVKGMAEQQQTAVAAEKQGAKTLATQNPDQAPKWQDKTSQSAGEQVDKAGQTMQNAGITTNASQSPEMKANLQAALDKSSGNGQNAPAEGGKCAAAQQQAAAAPPAAPAATQSMSK